MMSETLKLLNSIYKPLCEKSAEISTGFRSKGYAVTNGFYNNHSIRIGDGFTTEIFPIPVVFVEGVGDIGIDIETIWFEVKVSKEKALTLDYHDLESKYNFEIYGMEDYLTDIYNAQLTIPEISDKIRISPESSFCISFYISNESSTSDILGIAALLNC